MNSLVELVNALPECYQPIYGHPELGVNSSRNCNDRLLKIENIFSSLQQQLGRPLRLLDLGCAQGFFTFSLAKYCSKVTGIDFLDKNIAVCQALAAENGLDYVQFREDKIQNVIDELEYDDYDIVLGFSVFHHICDADGYLETKAKINKLANFAQIVMLELAVKEEGLYWARNLPDDPLDIVEDIGYFEILGEYSTHLSDVSRPLLFSSSKYWYLNEQLEPIVSWTKSSHEFASNVHQNSRRYFFSANKFLKRYSFNKGALSELNQEDFTSEVDSLKQLDNLGLTQLALPVLLHSEADARRGLVMTSKIAGERLSTALQRHQTIDEVEAVQQLLLTLAELETHGLYHNDIRIWNILHSEGKFHLIDFGSVSKNKADVLWPYNAFLSFIIFINELNSSNNYQLVPSRTPMFSPFWAKTPELAQFLSVIWSKAHTQWSYRFFLDTLKNIREENNKEFNVSIPAENIALWMYTTETLINEVRTRETSLVLQTQNEIIKRIDAMTQGSDNKNL